MVANESAEVLPLGTAGVAASPAATPAVSVAEILYVIGAGPRELPGLPFEAYCALPFEHSSLLKEMRRSPLHYRWRRDCPLPDSDTFRVGRATHASCFEPDTFRDRYTYYPSTNEQGQKQNRAGKKWDDFQAKNPGKTILKESDWYLALRMRTALLRHEITRGYLAEPGKGEHTVVWQDERTGLWIKIRIDWLCSILGDLKSTSTTSQFDFERSCLKYGYAAQFALYHEGAVRIGAGPMPVKCFSVEKDGPCDAAVFDVPPEILAFGRSQYEAALARVVECTKADEWPGAYPRELTLRLPAYATNDEEENTAPAGEWAFEGGQDG